MKFLMGSLFMSCSSNMASSEAFCRGPEMALGSWTPHNGLEKVNSADLEESWGKTVLLSSLFWALGLSEARSASSHCAYKTLKVHFPADFLVLRPKTVSVEASLPDPAEHWWSVRRFMTMYLSTYPWGPHHHGYHHLEAYPVGYYTAGPWMVLRCWDTDLALGL